MEFQILSWKFTAQVAMGGIVLVLSGLFEPNKVCAQVPFGENIVDSPAISDDSFAGRMNRLEKELGDIAIGDQIEEATRLSSQLQTLHELMKEATTSDELSSVSRVNLKLLGRLKRKNASEADRLKNEFISYLKERHESTLAVEFQGNVLRSQLSGLIGNSSDAEQLRLVLAELIQSFESYPPKDAEKFLRYLDFIGRHPNARDQIIGTLESLILIAENNQSPEWSKTADHTKSLLRRITLVGNEFEIKGICIDDASFDLRTLRGKVVLVDFWATWCGHCVKEFPHLRELREQYGDDGFEVVSVNLDENDEAFQKFMVSENLPWITLRSRDANAKGFSDPNVKRYAIYALPTVVLVGRDGRVLSTDARGERLDQLLKIEFPE